MAFASSASRLAPYLAALAVGGGSPETGAELAVVDDSPDLPGLQVSLDAGAGRLFLLPVTP